MSNPEWVSNDGRIRLINADCLSVLPELIADAVVTDPPYGMNAHDGTRSRRYEIDRSDNWDCQPITRGHVEAMFAVAPLLIKEPKYHAIAIERCKAEYARTALFDRAEVSA